MDLRIRSAAVEDLVTVSSILNEAAAWLHERGTPLWTAAELRQEDLARDVADSLYFIAEHQGEAVGALRFQLTDPDFWPDVPAHESAFVHRVAVRRRFAGGVVSAGMISWAARRARELGRGYLRLDCDAARPRLRAVYERMGFRYHSDRQIGRFLVARYELPLAVGKGASPLEPQP